MLYGSQVQTNTLTIFFASLRLCVKQKVLLEILPISLQIRHKFECYTVAKYKQIPSLFSLRLCVKQKVLLEILPISLQIRHKFECYTVAKYKQIPSLFSLRLCAFA